MSPEFTCEVQTQPRWRSKWEKALDFGGNSCGSGSLMDIAVEFAAGHSRWKPVIAAAGHVHIAAEALLSCARPSWPVPLPFTS